MSGSPTGDCYHSDMTYTCWWGCIHRSHLQRPVLLQPLAQSLKTSWNFHLRIWIHQCSVLLLAIGGLLLYPWSYASWAGSNSSCTVRSLTDVWWYWHTCTYIISCITRKEVTRNFSWSDPLTDLQNFNPEVTRSLCSDAMPGPLQASSWVGVATPT